MSLKFFITGTDTGIGKTTISSLLLQHYKNLGFSTLGIKPLATGVSEDATLLQQASTVRLPYTQINPISFEHPIAPHIAASLAKRTLCVDELVALTNAAFSAPSEVLIVEGIGGWHVPLNYHETMADFVIKKKLPVILVVGIKLGCINHAILTAQAILRSGLPFVGWVANVITRDGENETERIIASLKKWLKVPCLTVIPYLSFRISEVSPDAKFFTSPFFNLTTSKP